MIEVKVTLLDGSTKEYETRSEYWNERESFTLHSHSGKPAYVYYYDDGNVWDEAWFKEGKRHREGDKPAYIGYHKDGSIDYQYWYKEGKEITEEEVKASLCKDGHDYVETACGDYKANVCRRCLAREGVLV